MAKRDYYPFKVIAGGKPPRPQRRRRHRMATAHAAPSRHFALQLFGASVGVFAMSLVALNWPVSDEATTDPAAITAFYAAETAHRPDAGGSDEFAAASHHATRFGRCHLGGGANCVVDGDTLWAAGEKVRIANIDTPETHPAQCPQEAELGAAATRRLQGWLNQGPFDLVTNGERTHDRYGRRLARAVRGGEDVGAVLIAEGLARPYRGGPRAGWC